MTVETAASDERLPPGGAASGVRWSMVSLAGRQAVQLLLVLLLARTVGPDGYGLIGQAAVYITLSTLVLDQGLGSALIQQPRLHPGAAGALATVNLLLAGVLAVVTVAGAGAVGAFFHSPELSPVLSVLGAGLVVKGIMIAPRALLIRRFAFRRIAYAEMAGVITGGTVAAVAAYFGVGYWALVVQVMVTDLVIAVMLVAAAGGPVPTLRIGAARGLFQFGSRVFLATGLGFTARNLDNVLVGRYLGAASLAYYGLAYKVLLAPVQMLGHVVSGVYFPAAARAAADADRIRQGLERATRGLAVTAIPSMALVGIAAPQLVGVALGASWLPAVPVLQVLAFTGARQAIMSITTPLMMGLGRAALLLRFTATAALVQVVGIVIGLHWGVLGVAWGYSLAGLAVTPWTLALQHRLAGVSVVDQLRQLLPPLHAAAWMVVAYGGVSRLTGGGLTTLLVGAVLAVGVSVVVLAVAHRSYSRSVAAELTSVAGLRRPRLHRS
jgi:PST family polysaccharide transporter